MPDLASEDPAAFGELLRQHDPAMRRLASSMLRRSSAVDDVLQDAYLQAYRGRANFRGDAAFSTWLYRIVYRACLDHLRRIRPVENLESMIERRRDDHRDESDRLALADAIRRAMAELTPEHRAVVVLVDGDNHSYEEVADILHISPGTVASRLARARTALRRAYLDQVDTDRDHRDTDTIDRNDSGGRR